MPWEYCEECRSEIADWREGLKGCHRCGWKYYDLDDPEAKEIVNHLIDEIDELTEKVKRLDKLEEFVWEHVKRDSCIHHIQVDYQGQLCQSFSDNHYCERKKCPQFLE